MRAIWTGVSPRKLALGAALAAALAAAGLVGCAKNEPFDPATSPNAKPTVRLFARPNDPDGELAATSYNARTFYWSGNDQDGWVVEYHVSIRTDRDVPAPWTVTTSTDTTMTFETDENGQAEATFYLVGRDDRGALSDTVVQLVPLKNFPPVINFEPDFNPLYDLQREIVAAGDTNYWNWGVNSFRLFAYDPDGNETMDTFVRYTLSDVEPTVTVSEDDPSADPSTMWLTHEFGSEETGSYHFGLFFADAAPGTRTLTISLTDEADSDTRFVWDWEVREPLGPEGARVLYMQEGASVPTVFRAALDSTYGEGGWDVYRFWAQFPDKALTLVETLRKFDLVIWGNSGGASPNLEKATEKRAGLNNRSVLGTYVDIDAAEGGRLLMFSPTLVGYSSTLQPAFQQSVLGLQSLGSAVVTLTIPRDKLLLGEQPHLGTMISQFVYPQLDAVSLAANFADVESIYHMEECRGCYGSRNAPAQPVMGMRRPLRSTGEPARVVSLGFTPEEYFDVNNEATWIAVDALRGLLTQEMGVAPE